jgi:hypothetical protein
LGIHNEDVGFVTTSSINDIERLTGEDRINNGIRENVVAQRLE